MRSMRTGGVLHRGLGLGALLVVLVCVSTIAFSPASAWAANSFSGLACPSSSQCTAVDNAGREVTFDPAGPGTPTPIPIDGSAPILAVACPSVSQCTAIDEAGREVTFNPAAPASPTPTAIDSSARISAVACPSVSECTAVDNAGRAVTFDPTAPGTPAAATIDGSEEHPLAVACPSVSQCTAVDNGGAKLGADEHEITFDPAAPGNPAAVTVDQSRFCGEHCVHLGFVEGIACPSVSQCTAIDDAGQEVTFDPTAPGKPTPTYLPSSISDTGNPLERSPLSVTCPSVSQCTAVQEGGELTFDPNALGSPTPAHIDSGGWLRDVACPSSSQCTALEEACPLPTAASGCAPEDREACGEVTFNPNAPDTATRSVIDGDCLITGATTTTTTSGGIAKAGGQAIVKGGKAALKLTCTGSGACNGTVKLIARVTEKRPVKRHGKRRLVKRTRELVIGTASFSLANGASETLHVHLSAKGKGLLRKAGKKGLRVSLVGSDIKARSLVLKAP